MRRTPVWVWWFPGEPEDDLHGFMSIQARNSFERGDAGPFRRIVRDHHKLGPVPDDILAVREVTDKWK